MMQLFYMIVIALVAALLGRAAITSRLLPVRVRILPTRVPVTERQELSANRVAPRR